jgi:pimeloyl-ACP methyl ester carboxylesterase
VPRSKVVIVGEGPDLVLIPGIQGRWEWMRPAVRALAMRFRVITFSLAAPAPAGNGSGPASAGAGSINFDAHLDQVDAALDRAEARRAVVCGVSYGGLVAVRYAATRGWRVSELVLVSAPGPRWQPDERVRRYADKPWLSAPAFVLGARSRLWHEIAAARAGRLDRWAALGRYLLSVASHPASPPEMARRVAMLEPCDFAADARRVTAPTLVVTGEEDLDRVVPVGGTLEYLALIPAAKGVTLHGTGHIGLVTKPEAFALAVAAFVEGSRKPMGSDSAPL